MSSQYLPSQHSFTVPPLNSTHTTFSLNTSTVASSIPTSSFTPQTVETLTWLLGDGEDQARRWSSFIGIVVAISGNILISLAINVQKYAHIRLDREERRLQLELRKQAHENGGQQNGNSNGSGDEEDNNEERPLLGNGINRQNSNGTNDSSSSAYSHEDHAVKKSGGAKYLTSPLWWLGIILMCFGECGNFMAYGFASASIVSPLGVVALISNCIIAPLMLKEPFRGRDLFGVLVSIAGAVVVVSSAAPEEKKLGPDEILKAISQTAFEVYFGICCGLIVLFLYLSRKYGRKYVLVDLTLVGLFGGFTVLATKGVSSLLSSSFYHIVTMPIAYVFLFVLVSTAVLQIKYLNRALQRFDSTQVIPIQFVLFTISVIVGSAILYRDFEKLSRGRLIRFVIGCSLTFFGVYLISSDRPPSEHDYFAPIEDAESHPIPNPTPPPILTTTNFTPPRPINPTPVPSDSILPLSSSRPRLDRINSVDSTFLPRSFNPAESTTSTRRNSLIAARVPPIIGYHLQAAIGEHVAETIRDAVVSKRKVSYSGPHNVPVQVEGRSSVDEIVASAVEAARADIEADRRRGEPLGSGVEREVGKKGGEEETRKD